MEKRTYLDVYTFPAFPDASHRHSQSLNKPGPAYCNTPGLSPYHKNVGGEAMERVLNKGVSLVLHNPTVFIPTYETVGSFCQAMEPTRFPLRHTACYHTRLIAGIHPDEYPIIIQLSRSGLYE